VTVWQFCRTLCDSTHDYNKFGTGSRATLWDGPRAQNIDTRQALLDFHRQHYSANIMALCIVGGDTLDAMERNYVHEYFAKVENKKVDMKKWPVHPYSKDTLGWRLDIVPIKVCHLCLWSEYLHYII
jgi:insulysin